MSLYVYTPTCIRARVHRLEHKLYAQSSPSHSCQKTTSEYCHINEPDAIICVQGFLLLSLTT